MCLYPNQIIILISRQTKFVNFDWIIVSTFVQVIPRRNYQLLHAIKIHRLFSRLQIFIDLENLPYLSSMLLSVSQSPT